MEKMEALPVEVLHRVAFFLDHRSLVALMDASAVVRTKMGTSSADAYWQWFARKNDVPPFSAVMEDDGVLTPADRLVVAFERTAAAKRARVHYFQPHLDPEAAEFTTTLLPESEPVTSPPLHPGDWYRPCYFAWSDKYAAFAPDGCPFTVWDVRKNPPVKLGTLSCLHPWRYSLSLWRQYLVFTPMQCCEDCEDGRLHLLQIVDLGKEDWEEAVSTAATIVVASSWEYDCKDMLLLLLLLLSSLPLLRLRRRVRPHPGDPLRRGQGRHLLQPDDAHLHLRRGRGQGRPGEDHLAAGQL
jgi:hypothetical protein